MSEEDLKACMQCAELHETLEPCEAGCGRDLCPYCAPKCKECVDVELYVQRREEAAEEKRKKKEAVEKEYHPERSVEDHVWKAMDWVFGSADTALRSELEHYRGEFDEIEDFNVLQDVMRDRYKHLSPLKKKLYKVKKYGEKVATRAAVKAMGKFSSTMGDIKRASRLIPKSKKEDYGDDDIDFTDSYLREDPEDD